MERQGHGTVRLLLVASLGGPLWITMAYLVVVLAATITTAYYYYGTCVARAESCGYLLPGRWLVYYPIVHRCDAFLETFREPLLPLPF